MSERAEILRKATECVTGQRQQDYGSPEDNFTIISKLWSIYLGMQISPEDVAMMMCLLKVARIATAPEIPTEDCFVDLAGYAACAGEIVAGRRKGGTA